MRISFNWLAVLALLLMTACGGETATNGTADKGSHEKIDGEKVLNEFKDCKEAQSEKTACKEFAAKAICGLCEINDFVKTEQPREYIAYEEISGVLLQSDSWRALGDADEQSVLDEAQKLANAGGCVVAISTASETGNVAWIVPGKQVKSNSWGLNCPTCATFIPTSPDRSFVGKTLNYAWQSPEDVVLYARN